MPVLRVVVRDMPSVFKKFDELTKGEIYRRAADPRQVVYMKLNNREYAILSHPIQGPGGPWEMSPSARDHSTCVPINGVLEIKG